MKAFLFIAALFASSTAFAADKVALNSKIFVERQVTASNGKSTIVREDPTLVVPGEKLLFILDYKNEGAAPAERFVVTNPIPSSVVFVASDAAGADYSIDGGHSWGALAALKVKGADGQVRPALAGDVTHIRWVFVKAIPVGGVGKLSFRGTVR